MIPNTVQVVLHRFKIFTNYLISKPAIFIALIFLFILLRNYSILGLTDVYDGFTSKVLLVSNGASVQTTLHYITQTALTPYDQHFIPAWFLFILPIYYLDVGPLLMGIMSFAVAAMLLYLMFRIISYFTKDHENSSIYSGIVILTFSSSVFFLELIAWRWMLCLLISSACLCFALLITLERKAGPLWTAIYTTSLVFSLWTFGTAWVGIWGIGLFLVLSRRHKDIQALIAIFIAFFGTIIAVIASGTTNRFNVGYLAQNILEMTALITANLSAHLFGIVRISSIDHSHISTVTAGVVITAIAIQLVSLYRTKLFSEKHAFLVAFALVYLALIFLSLIRIMPQQGVDPSASLDGYIFGNRYLFVYSIPFILIFGVMLKDHVLKLPRYLLYIVLVGGFSMGVLTGSYYKKSDPFITNDDRIKFYKLTPIALREASSRSLILPDIEGDLFFKNRQTKLSDAIKFQKDSTKIHVIFKTPSTLSQSECGLLRDNHKVTLWLELYNKDWCR